MSSYLIMSLTYMSMLRLLQRTVIGRQEWTWSLMGSIGGYDEIFVIPQFILNQLEFID